MMIQDISLEPPLIQSIFSNDVEHVKEVLSDKSTDIKYQDFKGRGVLHAVAFMGNENLADMLIISGAQVDKKDHLWQTACHIACRMNHVTVLDVLVEHGANTSVRDHTWELPLHIACSFNALRCCDLLLKLNSLSSNAAIRDQINTSNRKGQTPMHLACAGGYSELVQLLIDFGALIDAADKKNRRPLHFAAYFGHIDCLYLLLANNADPLLKDIDGYSAFLCAAAGGSKACLECLYEFMKNNNQDIFILNSSTNTGDTALHLAANRGHEEVVKFLLKCSANVDALNAKNLTPLHIATASTDGALVLHELINSGANVNLRSIDGKTALHYAAQYGRVTRAQVLLRNGADVHVTDLSLSTPLLTTTRWGHCAMAKALISAGANVNQAGLHQITPLMIASYISNFDLINAMLAEKSDLNACDKYGRTCLHFCAMNRAQSDACLSLLLKAGASATTVDHTGRLPLHYLAYSCVYKPLCFLLNHCRQEINLLDVFRRSALLYAVASSECDIMCVAELLSQGADPAIPDVDGLTALHYAAKRADFEVLKLIMHKMDAIGMRQNPTFVNRLRPIHFAANNSKSVATISYLLESGFKEAEAKTTNGSTALHFSCAVGSDSVIRILLNQPIDVLAVDDAKRTALHILATFGHIECTKTILNAVSPMILHKLLDSRDIKGRTALQIAISNAYFEIAVLLMDAGGNFNIPDLSKSICLHRLASLNFSDHSILKRAQLLLKKIDKLPLNDYFVCNEYSLTPIDMAIRKSNRFIFGIIDSKLKNLSSDQYYPNGIRLLPGSNKVVDNASANYANKKNWPTYFTALHNACYWAQEFFVEVLLEINIHRLDIGHPFSPVHCAVLSKSELCLSLLSEKFGPKIAERRDHRDRIPLHISAIVGTAECAEILLKLMPSCVDMVDFRGRSSLMEAARNNHERVLTILLQAGADMALIDAFGNNALHYCCERAHDQIACALLDNITDVSVLNAQNSELKTPLHLACKHGLVATVEKLLLKGANPYIVDSNDNVCALYCTSSERTADCLALILCVIAAEPNVLTPRSSYSSLISFQELTKMNKNSRGSAVAGDSAVIGQSVFVDDKEVVSDKSSDSEYY